MHTGIQAGSVQCGLIGLSTRDRYFVKLYYLIEAEGVPRYVRERGDGEREGATCLQGTNSAYAYRTALTAQMEGVWDLIS